MSDIIRRLADDDPNDDDTWAGSAVVTDTDAGATYDGRLRIEIEWRGATYRCAYLASYTPGIGDRVAFIKNGPSLFVLGVPARI